MATGFQLLHPSVQRVLYEKRWSSLHPIQDLAIGHLLHEAGDCVITAATAGGKTEAAFLPILSRLVDVQRPGVGAMYIGPLKALINDQFRRVEELCQKLEIPVHRWHGDVGASAKKALLKAPRGVLLITPESLEALFVLRATQMPSLFANLQHVVIDELHAFIGSVRGAQLLSQLHRLRERCGCDPVRVGLSATLGDPVAACRWLRPHGAQATHLADSSPGREIRIKASVVRSRALLESDSIPDDNAALAEVARRILRVCHAGTNLVFSNAKGRIEELADHLQTQATAMGIPHDVLVHHGSLSKDQREYVEQRLTQERPCTAVCSNTLEMGVDIGEVDTVIQVDAPWSVASLTQRLGRSGRRNGAPAILRAFTVESPPSSEDTPWDCLRLETVRAIAMIELMLARFSEPHDTSRQHLSTLIHQLLSTLAETGGMAAKGLYARLIESGAFGQVSEKEFVVLLRSLASHGLIEQMGQGDLVLGSTGEKLRDHYSFYAAFAGSDDLRVVHGTQEIGVLPATLVPPVGEHVLLAGRRWCVREISSEERVVSVTPSQGRRPPQFESLAADIHPRVHQAMRALLLDETRLAYLDETAQDVLSSARQQAVRLRRFQPALQEVHSERSRLFVWAGSRVQRTLGFVLRRSRISFEDQGVGFDIQASASRVAEVLATFSDAEHSHAEFALQAARLGARAMDAEKFDEYVPDTLWCHAYAEQRLDIEAARVFAGAASGVK